MKLVPEMYAVTSKNVNAEIAEPNSQDRVPVGRCPFLWAQSLYLLGKLLQDVSYFSELSLFIILVSIIETKSTFVNLLKYL